MHRKIASIALIASVASITSIALIASIASITSIASIAINIASSIAHIASSIFGNSTFNSTKYCGIDNIVVNLNSLHPARIQRQHIFQKLIHFAFIIKRSNISHFFHLKISSIYIIFMFLCVFQKTNHPVIFFYSNSFKKYKCQVFNKSIPHTCN